LKNNERADKVKQDRIGEIPLKAKEIGERKNESDTNYDLPSIPSPELGEMVSG
jgi:hypothetical protein